MLIVALKGLIFVGRALWFRAHGHQRLVLGDAIPDCEHVALKHTGVRDLDLFDHGVRVEVELAQEKVDLNGAGSRASCPSLNYPTRFARNFFQLS
jgi:hypothetical protein